MVTCAASTYARSNGARYTLLTRHTCWSSCSWRAGKSDFASFSFSSHSTLGKSNDHEGEGEHRRETDLLTRSTRNREWNVTVVALDFRNRRRRVGSRRSLDGFGENSVPPCCAHISTYRFSFLTFLSAESNSRISYSSTSHHRSIGLRASFSLSLSYLDVLLHHDHLSGPRNDVLQ